MTVKKLGRPSKADTRRLEILLAMRVVAARDGLSETTVGSVAQEAGLQRTLVFHYFRDRASMLDAFVDWTVAAYGDQQLLAGQDGDLTDRVEAAFAPAFYEDTNDLAIWQELIALATRDPHLAAKLRALWSDRWLPRLEQELHTARPTASRTQVSRVAYALAALVEGHWSLVAQGVPTAAQTRAARQAARALIQSLTQ